MLNTADYAQPLRTMGQDLEVLRVEAFEIESVGNDYIIRGRTEVPPLEESPSHAFKKSGLRAVWGRFRGRYSEQKEPTAHQPSSVGLELHYTPEDIERLEREGQARRRDPNRMPNAHSTSQLLRAVGAYVDHKGARLLAVSWRDQSVSIVYETAQGRRELDVFRLDSMYDFWVRMYLRRVDRTRSDGL
ncbi:MAG: hypothetical protein O7B35_12525 [Deltaproteobacteria bacterium]|nr:hypothetical protein [Deltaproteobacteria bacterium]